MSAAKYPKYACKTYEDTIKLAKLPKQLFPKSIATPGLVAAVIDAKFNRHLPLYRQEDMFKSMGTEISRTNLGNWIVKESELLKPIVDKMIKQIKVYDVAYADETVLQVINEKGKLSTSKSYMWLFGGGPPDKLCFVYRYHPNPVKMTSQMSSLSHLQVMCMQIVIVPMLILISSVSSKWYVWLMLDDTSWIL